MVASVSFNPFITTSAGNGMFNVTSDGLRQGSDMADPSATWRLRGGILSADETLPMWGGVGVYMDVPPYTKVEPHESLGVIMGRATALTGNLALAGFSVFQSNYSWITTPQSPVPMGGSGSQVNAYPLGSLARIVVACDPGLVSLWRGPIRPQVSWDFVNQLLVPYNAAALVISSGTYNTTTGVATLTMSAPINFSAGDAVVIDTATGTGSFAALNGAHTAIVPTTGSTVSVQLATGLTMTITGGGLNLGSGAGSALPVSVLAVRQNNCITVGYDAVTGFGTWNYDGSCAIIQL